jgi:hypothetical protein
VSIKDDETGLGILSEINAYGIYLRDAYFSGGLGKPPEKLPPPSEMFWPMRRVESVQVLPDLQEDQDSA